jgi:diguanylate cyclase (GGDEF)-like protein
MPNRTSLPPPRVWALSAIIATDAFCALTISIFPVREGTVPRRTLILAAGLILLALAVWRFAKQWNRVQMYLIVMILAVLLAVAVIPAQSPQSVLLAGLGLPWIAAYLVFFFRSRWGYAAIGIFLAAFVIATIIAGVAYTRALTIIIVAITLVSSAMFNAVARNLEALSRIDGLTGALTRVGFGRLMERCIREQRRSKEELALVAIDFDGFKAINDEHGHAEGDRVLRLFVDELRPQLRSGDLLCRHGGDEFLLVLPNCGLEQAREITARLKSTSSVAWSFGVATLAEQDTIDTLIEHADRCLYEVKQSRTGTA